MPPPPTHPLLAPPLPVHLIAGPLGVGKTTAILDYVARCAGTEHIAVLVNDYGPMGLDGDILQSAGGRTAGDTMELLTIPGGCLCCAAPDALALGIPKLAAIPGVTRIIVEPSGIAMPGQVVDLLRSLPAALNLDLRPTIVMLDAAEFRYELAQQMPYYQYLVEAADILVGNRCDKADDAAIARFTAWAQQLDPPKLHVITTTQGRLPDTLFAPPPGSFPHATRSGSSSPGSLPPHSTIASGGPEVRPKNSPRAAPPLPGAAGLPHATGLGADPPAGSTPTDAPSPTHPGGASAGGRTWDAATVFVLHRLLDTITELHTTAGLERFKGLFNTDVGWRLIELARGQVTERLTGHRRDNRADWITTADPADHDAIARRIEAARHNRSRSPQG